MKVQMIQNNVASQPKNKRLYWPKNLYSSTDCEDMCSNFISGQISQIFFIWPISCFLHPRRCGVTVTLNGLAAAELVCAPRAQATRAAHARAEKRERDFPSPITLHMWTGGFLHMPAHVEVFLCTFKRHNYKGCLQFLIGCKLRA